jgi:hypothetical protein
MDFDGPYKKLFSNPGMIEDLMKNFVHEDWVQTLDFTTLELLNSSFIGDQIQRLSNVNYLCRLATIIFAGVESKI